MQRNLRSPMKSTIAKVGTAPLPPVNDPHTEICGVNWANMPQGTPHKTERSPMSRTFEIKGKKK